MLTSVTARDRVTVRRAPTFQRVAGAIAVNRWHRALRPRGFESSHDETTRVYSARVSPSAAMPPMKEKLSAITLAASMLLLAPLSVASLGACGKDTPNDPAPAPPAPTPTSTSTTPPTSTDPATEDAGRRDLSDSGYYPGKSTKPM